MAELSHLRPSVSRFVNGLQAAVILAAAWFVYSPALHGDWLWDDDLEITRNPVLRDPAGLGRIWLAPVGADYFPLKTTVQWFEWRLWQDNVTGYHASSVGLHLLSAFLLWHLLRKLGVRLAWVGGLLFAIHPVAVESVAWISELKNTLSLPPLLLAMCAYLDWDERRQRSAYVRAVLWFLAAMLCKSSVVMFPVVVLLHGRWRRGRITPADLKGSAVFFAISLVLGLVTIWFQLHRAIGGWVIPAGGFFSRLAGAGLAVSFYFFKCVLPAGLVSIYPRWTLDPPSLRQFLPWPVLGAVLVWLWARRTTWGRHALFGLGGFLLTLLPVLGFVPMSFMRYSLVADHFVYLPLVSLIGLAAAGLSHWRDRTTMGRQDQGIVSWWHRPVVLWSCTVAVVAALAFAGRRHAGIFRNKEALWTYTLQHNPQAWIAHNELGLVLASSGRLREAVTRYEEALRLNPDYPEAHINLGNAWFQMGKAAEAAREYEAALRTRSNFAREAHLDLGHVLLQMGKVEEAVGQYEAALRLHPDYAEAHYSLGNALMEQKRIPEAIAQFRETLRIRPNDASAHNNLGGALLLAGRVPEAISEFEASLRLRPDDAATRANLERAQALQQAGAPGN